MSSDLKLHVLHASIAGTVLDVWLSVLTPRCMVRKMYLFGDFNAWDPKSHPCYRDQFGVWSIVLPDVDEEPAIPHGSRYWSSSEKVTLRTCGNGHQFFLLYLLCRVRNWYSALLHNHARLEMVKIARSFQTCYFDLGRLTFLNQSERPRLPVAG